MLLRLEQQALSSGFRRIAGVDEAGRGPLAGPVVAAAVVIHANVLRDHVPEELVGLNDSKQLTQRQRELFFDRLHQLHWLQFGVGQSSVAEIDASNILQTTLLAMQRAVNALDEIPDFVLVDGNRLPAWEFDCKAVVKGDSKSLSMAAASVLAKVTRDKIMVKMDTEYPQYGFARHKGYGTKAHLAALNEHGPCKHHRLSFRPCREAGAA